MSQCFFSFLGPDFSILVDKNILKLLVVPHAEVWFVVRVSDVFCQVTGHVAGKLAERTRVRLSVHVRIEVPLQVVFRRKSKMHRG
jgi:hypothetical protein